MIVNIMIEKSVFPIVTRSKFNEIKIQQCFCYCMQALYLYSISLKTKKQNYCLYVVYNMDVRTQSRLPGEII